MARRSQLRKPCGHPWHPEDGNLGVVKEGSGPRVDRGAEVEAHRNEPSWFIGKFCKLGFPTPQGPKEYMWVSVKSVDGFVLKGGLDNTPVRALAQHGDAVEFTSDEIVDVYSK